MTSVRSAPARLLMAAALAVAVAMTGVSSAQAGPGAWSGADLAVQLDATESLLLPRIRYTVAVTNHGPQALTSAIVVVQLDPRQTSVDAPQCTVDAAADTVSCPFAGVAAGATATIGFWAHFTGLPWSPTSLNATATRVSSTPSDPNGANDSDSARCSWDQPPGLVPPFEIIC